MLDKLPMSFDTRYFPAFLSLALLGLLLLFTKELPSNTRYFIPLIGVHTIFSGFLGYLQSMWLIRRRGEMLAVWQWRVVWICHLVSATGVLFYCFYRGIL